MLQGLYKMAGFKGQKVCFIFTDSEIKEESFLEYINQILMTGEVAGLFPKDELDMIVNDIRPAMKKVEPQVPPTKIRCGVTRAVPVACIGVPRMTCAWVPWNANALVPAALVVWGWPGGASGDLLSVR